MKKLVVLACLALAPVLAQATEIYVCTGTVGTETITVVDDGRALWTVKGTFDINVGPGSLPKYRFAPQILKVERQADAGTCTITAEGENSVVLTSDCGVTEVSASSKLSVNVPAIGLSGADIPLICNVVDAGNNRRQSAPAPSPAPAPVQVDEPAEEPVE